MSRDPNKLRVFHDAHFLTLAIYKHTRNFPSVETYGLRQQIRRAAASVPINIVEGCARTSTKDCCRFLSIALGSACETAYIVGLALELGFITRDTADALQPGCNAVVRQLQRLVSETEILALQDASRAPRRAPLPRHGGSAGP